MQLLRTLRTADAGDSDDDLLDNWPKGQAAVALDLDLDLPVTVGKVGGYTPTAADLAAILKYFLGVVSLSYGAKAQHKPYQGISGDKLRRFERIMSQAEVYNDFVGVAQTAAAHVLHARVRLHVNRKLAKGVRRFIGWTQGRTIKLDIREGAAFPAQGAALLSRTAGVDFVCRVMPVYRIGPDQFTHFPYYREVNRAAQDATLPDGRPLAVWDDNAAADATAIGKFSLFIGEAQLHRQLEPKYVTRDFRGRIDAGGSDFTDEVTPLYVADPFEDEVKLPVGVPNVQLLAQDVATIQARWFGFPVVNESDAATIVAEAAEARGETVTGTIPVVPSNPDDNGHVSVSPIEMVGAQSMRSGLVPGLMADRDGTVSVHVPEHAQAVAKAAGNKSLAARVEKVNALAIPGTHSTNGASVGGKARTVVRGMFAAFR